MPARRYFAHTLTPRLDQPSFEQFCRQQRERCRGASVTLLRRHQRRMMELAEQGSEVMTIRGSRQPWNRQSRDGAR